MDCTIKARGPRGGIPPGGVHKDEALTLRAIAQAKRGDRHAVRYLYTTYYTSVLRYVNSVLQDMDAAEDVAQTTFLKMLTKIDRYEPREVPFEAWLLRVARNAAFDELRRCRAVPCADVEERNSNTATSVTVDTAVERFSAMQSALARLPHDAREAVVLRHVVGMPWAEIADRLGVDENEARALDARGRIGLRNRIAASTPLQARRVVGVRGDARDRGLSDRRRRPVVEAVV